MADLEVDPSQVHSVEVDPSQVSAMPKSQEPAGGGFWHNLYEGSIGGVINTAKRVIGTQELSDIADLVKAGKYKEAALKVGQYGNQGPGGRLAGDVVNNAVQNYKQGVQHVTEGKIGAAAGDAMRAVPVAGPMIMGPVDLASQGNYRGAAGLAAGEALMLGAPIAAEAAAARLPASVKIGGITPANPVEAAAVKWAAERNPAMLDAGTATGNSAVKGIQQIADRSIAGSITSAKARQGQVAALAQTGSDLAAEVNDNGPAVQPLQAARQVAAKAEAKVTDLHGHANEAYGQLRQIEQRPENTVEVETGTNEDGTPVTERMQAPVYLRDAKALLRPLYQQITRQMPVTLQRASWGLKAIENILSSRDYEPLSQVDMDLGTIKGISRGADLPELKDLSQGLGARAVQVLEDQVQQAARRMGPEAEAARNAGRAATEAKYDAADVLKQLRNEPGQLFQQLTYRKDAGVEFLKRVRAIAPEEMSNVGRAVIEDMLNTATEGGGFDKARTLNSKWQQLGDETKGYLYRPSQVDALNKFFTVAEKATENVNPSGSGHVGILAAQGTHLVFNPSTAIPLQIGGALLSKFLHSPAGVKLLTEGLTVPLRSPRGAFLANQISKMAEEQGGGDTAAAGGPPPTEPTPPPPAAARALMPNEPEPAPPAEPMFNGPWPKMPDRPTIAAGSTDPVPFQSRAPIMGDTLPKGAPADEIRDSGPAGEGEKVSPNAGPGGETIARPGAKGKETAVRVPGSTEKYPARYAVRELEDVQSSHNGQSFEPNPRYRLKNDRDYTQEENQGKVVNWSTEDVFDPSFHVTDNPDATNGPVITDAQGNALGGNGRTMILQRVYDTGGKGAAAYKQMLMDKAQQFGLNPEQIAGMKRPVLVREIPDEYLQSRAAKQKAVTDFNVKGTAELTPSERAIADSRRVSQSTLDHISGKLEDKGADATLGQVLDGNSGTEIINRLIDDGVISDQERAAFMKRDGLTPAGKDRISKLLLGRFFEDPAQMDNLAPAMRNKLERIAAPLSQLDSNPYWSLTPDLQKAMSLIEEARSHGMSDLEFYADKYTGLYGNSEFPPEVVKLAKHLQNAKPTELQYAVEQYLERAKYSEKYEGPGMFGEFPAPQKPAEAFDELLGGEKLAARPKPAKDNPEGGPVIFGKKPQ